MPRKNKSFLGRRSGALDVQGEVCLDNPGVVIDRMTPEGGSVHLVSAEGGWARSVKKAGACVSHCGSGSRDTPLRGWWFIGGVERGLTPTPKSTSSLRDYKTVGRALPQQ